MMLIAILIGSDVLLLSLVGYLTTLSVWRPVSFDDRMISESWAIGGMRIGRGNRSTGRKPAPVPLCPPQFPHDLGSNPGRRDGKPMTNRLSCGTFPQELYVMVVIRDLIAWYKMLIPVVRYYLQVWVATCAEAFAVLWPSRLALLSFPSICIVIAAVETRRHDTTTLCVLLC
jgi:hypothetical protein